MSSYCKTYFNPYFNPNWIECASGFHFPDFSFQRHKAKFPDHGDSPTALQQLKKFVTKPSWRRFKIPTAIKIDPNIAIFFN